MGRETRDDQGTGDGEGTRDEVEATHGEGATHGKRATDGEGARVGKGARVAKGARVEGWRGRGSERWDEPWGKRHWRHMHGVAGVGRETGVDEFRWC